MTKENNIILFDGVCNLCNSFVQRIIKADKKRSFKFCSLQAEAAKELLQKAGLLENHYSSVVYLNGRKPYLKSDAALQIAKDLGGLWRLFYAFILIPKPFRDIFYDFVAKNRYKWFGKKEQCMLPSTDLQDRFL